MLTGVYKPDEGIVKLDGQDITGKKTIDINKAGIPVLPEYPPVLTDVRTGQCKEVGLHNHHHYNTLEGSSASAALP